jgi:serine/threonine protein kinase/Tol biopolymer transport system component
MTPEIWQRLKPIYEAAVAKPAEERAEFIKTACEDDDQLREELESLLEANDNAQSLGGPMVRFESLFGERRTFEKGERILGKFEVLSFLGAGGMGEVYRARDSALKREVAIKVLPASVSRDPERLARFEHEAQAAAALNHPNILAVHQFGVFEGAPYLVSELLTGESLRQVLQRGPLPFRKAVAYGVQIAHGFAAAHDHGVVHRDLKPENLFVTKDGRVKILDFGLAKLIQHRPESGDGGTPTQTIGTSPGMVMGTAGYMSPEQVRGNTVDHRTDIFAFGAVLYEMLSGKRAFQRQTSAETMSAVLNEDPPAISQTAATIPPALQRLVHRCLEKNAEQRFQSASDLAFALEALSDSGSTPAVASGASSRVTQRRAILWSTGLVAVALLAAVAWLVLANRNSDPPLRISEYTQLTHSGHTGYVVGTDGSRLYLTHVVRLSIDQVAVSGGEIETIPSISVTNPWLVDVSPDGSSLLVQSLRGTPSPPLYAVQVVGGAHRYLADAMPAGGTWSPDGKLVAYSTLNGDINIINSDATGAHKLASVGGPAFPLTWSPDGSTVRFSRDLSSLWEITSSGSNLHQLLARWHPSEDKCCGHWSPDGGYFVFLAGSFGSSIPQGRIYVLDERRGLFRRPAKDPIQLTSGPIEWSPPVFSKDGKNIFATGSTKRGELVRLDAKSNQFQPFLGGISANMVAFSKDGQSIAYVSYPDGILWKANRDGSERIQLTSTLLHPTGPVWSPDGSQLAFEAPSPQGADVWIVASAGGSPQRLIPEDSGPENSPDWSPDGRKIVFGTGVHGSHESHIRILDLASHQISTLPDSDGKLGPGWSPDGQSIMAQSLDGHTLYVFDIKTQYWSIPYKGPFAYPLWSSDSGSVYFLRWVRDPAILRIAVTGGEARVVAPVEFPFTGTADFLWFGLDPTDAPLMLRDVSTTDVYALTLEGK